jgi:predicted GTPase
VVRSASPVALDDPERVTGRRVVVVEDGPTLTHGGMAYGAGHAAATAAGAAAIVDPRHSAAPAVAEVYARYPHIGPVLPAVGYDDAQMEALSRTLRDAEADVVVSASPIDLSARMDVGKPIVRARYDYADAGEPTLGGLLDVFVEERVRESVRA